MNEARSFFSPYPRGLEKGVIFHKKGSLSKTIRLNFGPLIHYPNGDLPKLKIYSTPLAPMYFFPSKGPWGVKGPKSTNLFQETCQLPHPRDKPVLKHNPGHRFVLVHKKFNLRLVVLILVHPRFHRDLFKEKNPGLIANSVRMI